VFVCVYVYMCVIYMFYIYVLYILIFGVFVCLCVSSCM